jgi:methionyl-tRNA formyltransferase
MARVVYMGTPAFAVPPLQALLDSGHQVVTVVTPPERPAGRSGAPLPSPVKKLALEHGLAVWQPPKLRSPAAAEQLQALAPEVIVVAAYGAILPAEVLAIPPHGCLNVHASLLPRHRGAAPIVAAILAGDRETGITIMLMDAGLDTGPILAQEAIPLTGQEHQGELTARLAELGAGLLPCVLLAWLAGQITPQPQDASQATFCQVLRKGDGAIDWTRPAWHIERMVRAYDPWPGAYTFLRGRRLHIWRAAVVPGGEPARPGMVHVAGGKVLVSTGEGALDLQELQLEGKRRLTTREFLHGQRDLDRLTLL